MRKKIKSLNSKIVNLIKLLKTKTKSHPYIVVISMHELFRNLYAYDPYIKIEQDNFIKQPNINLGRTKLNWK